MSFVQQQPASCDLNTLYSKEYTFPILLCLHMFVILENLCYIYLHVVYNLTDRYLHVIQSALLQSVASTQLSDHTNFLFCYSFPFVLYLPYMDMKTNNY
jgi:hypothetical protein